MSNPLNDPDIDGNTLNFNQEDGIVYQEWYLCPDCGCRVKDQQWDKDYKLCKECVNDGYENYQARYGDI